MATSPKPTPRLLLGPGPCDAHPRFIDAMATPLLGHLDPQFLEVGSVPTITFKGDGSVVGQMGDKIDFVQSDADITIADGVGLLLLIQIGDDYNGKLEYAGIDNDKIMQLKKK